MLTREFIALMTPGVTFLYCARPDLTLPTMHELLIRQAAMALNIFYGQIFSIRKNPFSRNSSLVEIRQ